MDLNSGALQAMRTLLGNGFERVGSVGLGRGTETGVSGSGGARGAEE